MPALTPEAARELVLASLRQAAPDVDPADLAGDDDLRATAELDSLDFLRFVELLSEGSGRRIEEEDYPRVNSLDAAIGFLSAG